ncbi:uncharacterized protein LOC106705292 [Latimeria chalumnae]|uniref:uncharacterized protein LOC106705292 n=1 Tax=Latimeria chalumnae TaxID=7897 RepID=UPI0006D913BC|nr:PREDICTED: uncharacterized protein LOC106705292 isoform X2 [Latimeria chalumnae]|eukprot:XP_014349768.1 PREDICTED: uncharacterized protein LOC106705292 isoform X2 [Latimeria chalumnae]
MAEAKHCCVVSCKKSSELGKKAILHPFPQDLSRRKSWVQAIIRSCSSAKQLRLVESTENAFVCSAHFLPEQEGSETAVPSVFRILRPLPRKRRKKKGLEVKKSGKVTLLEKPEPSGSRENPGDSQSGIGDLVLAAELMELVSETVQHVQREARSQRALGHDHGAYAIPEDPATLRRMVRQLKGAAGRQAEQLSALQKTLSEKSEEFRKLTVKLEGEKWTLSVDLGQRISQLEAENTNLRFERVALEKKVQQQQELLDSSGSTVLYLSRQLRERASGARESLFSLENLKADGKQLRFYTGFSSYERFTAFLDFVMGDPALCAARLRGGSSEAVVAAGPQTTLSREDQLFLVLIRLRLGLLLQDLAYRFRVSESTVSRLWLSWTELIHARLMQMPIMYSPKYVDAFHPKRAVLHQGVPLVLLECTDLHFEVPSRDRSKQDPGQPCRNSYTRRAYAIAGPSGFMAFATDMAFGEGARAGPGAVPEAEEEEEEGEEEGSGTSQRLSLPVFLCVEPAFLTPEQQQWLQVRWLGHVHRMEEV